MDKKRIIFVTVCMVLIFGCGMGIHVRGEGSRARDLTNDYYKSIEQMYVKHIRTELELNGYRNAGVSLNKVMNESGELEYTVNVHHRRIDKMSPYQREQLSDIIIDGGVAVDNSSTTIRYIEF